MWRAQSQKRRKMIALMNKNMKGGCSLKLTSSLLSVLMLYFASVTALLVTKYGKTSTRLTSRGMFVRHGTQ
jgi:hypothetical protein